MPWLLAGRHRGADLQQADRGSVGGGSGGVFGSLAACQKPWFGTGGAGFTPTTTGQPRSSRRFAGSCGLVGISVGHAIRRPKVLLSGWGGGYAETNFEPGRVFANELDFQDQQGAWFTKVNARTHKTIRERPADRLLKELAVMAALPADAPDTDRRWVTRVPPDPYFAL